MARLAGTMEERLLLPTYGGRWPLAPIALHRGLSLPLQLAGPLRRGTAASAGGPVELAAVGRAKLIAPLAQRLLGSALPEPAATRHGLWSPGALDRLEGEMVFAEVHPWMAPRFRRSGWLVVPDAVRWIGELAEVPGPTPPRSLREDLRKVARQGFRLSQATAPADWEMFATRMVEPQARARYGEEAWVPSPRLLRELRDAGTLHLVHQGDDVVAGICSVPRGDTLWIPVMGVRDADPTLFRRGASLAAVALSIEWARARGFRAVDLGRTSPFLNDGVQRMKRKWGLHPALDPLAHLVAIRARSAAARAAFVREPLFVVDWRGLRVHGAPQS